MCDRLPKVDTAYKHRLADVVCAIMCLRGFCRGIIKELQKQIPYCTPHAIEARNRRTIMSKRASIETHIIDIWSTILVQKSTKKRDIHTIYVGTQRNCLVCRLSYPRCNNFYLQECYSGIGALQYMNYWHLAGVALHKVYYYGSGLNLQFSVHWSKCSIRLPSSLWQKVNLRF